MTAARYAGRGVHGQVVEELARRVLRGDLAEGATLDLAALRAELDVSSTLLREALKVLTAKGMVDARQKRGTFVRPRAEWNLLDADVLRWEIDGGRHPAVFDELHEVRLIIEPAAARLAASRRTPQDLDTLDTALRAMRDAATGPDEVAADVAYHRALLRAAGNELLQRLEVVFEGALAERDQFVHMAPHEDPVPAHLAVVEAVRDRDPDRAEQAMRELIESAHRDVQRVKGNQA